MFANPAYCRIQAETHRQVASQATLPAVSASLQRSAIHWEMMAAHGEEFERRELLDREARAARSAAQRVSEFLSRPDQDPDAQGARDWHPLAAANLLVAGTPSVF